MLVKLRDLQPNRKFRYPGAVSEIGWLGLGKEVIHVITADAIFRKLFDSTGVFHVLNDESNIRIVPCLVLDYLIAGLNSETFVIPVE